MILVDTNVLARSLQVGHAHQKPALDALISLRSTRSEVLVITPQTIIEFYSVCTCHLNALNFTPEDTLREIQNLKRDYPLLPETPDLFGHWESLVAKYKPTNREVFDMRFVAFMLLHEVPAILTFNDRDFSRFTEIQVLNPFDLLNRPRMT